MFGMLEHGHIKRMLPLIMGLVRAGQTVYVFAHRRFREEIERAGGQHINLFRERPLDAADATSIPIPCRYVSFAARYADEITAEAAELGPGLLVHDTFAVVGAVVARRLRLPCVNMCVGHNHAPEPTLAELARDPRVAVSDDCKHAVQQLREHGDLPDASPFSYITTLSRELNVYCEPPAFLHDDEREVFQPIAFSGSLSTETIARPAPATSLFSACAPLRIYVSFGTIIWRYYQAEAAAALEVIADVVASMPHAQALVSLGGDGRGELGARLGRQNVRVVSYVNQWDALAEASVFITHHGLNSTHEAIYQRVPMISYPFFADQPALARRCQELRLAVPLGAGLRGPISCDDVRAALARVLHERVALQARLNEARSWEQTTIDQRCEVVARMIALMR